MIFKLAWLNMFRKKKRTLLILLTIVLCVMVVQIFDGWINAMRDNYQKDLEQNQGHIQIKHQKLVNAASGISPSEYPFSGLSEIVQFVNTLPSVKKIHPFIQFGAFIIHDLGKSEATDTYSEDKPQMPAFITGVPRENPHVFETYRKSIRKGGRFIANAGEVVVGFKMAFTLGIEIGDSVQLMTIRQDSSLYYQSFTAVGIFQTQVAEEDQGMAIISFEDASKMMGYNDQATLLAIMIREPDQAIEVSQTIQTWLDTKFTTLVTETLPMEANAGIQWYPLAPQSPSQESKPTDKVNAPSNSLKGDPVLILNINKETLKGWAKTHKDVEALVQMVANTPTKKEWGWAIQSGKKTENMLNQAAEPKALEILLASDFGWKQEHWYSDGMFPIPIPGLPDRSLLRLVQKDASSQDSLPDASMNSLETMMAGEAMVEQMKQSGLDVDALYQKSMELVDSFRTAIQEAATIKIPQAIVSDPWQRFNRSIIDLLKISDQFIYYVFIIFAIAVAAIIMNNILISVFERVREIGTLRAIGWGRMHIVGLIEVEAVWIGLVGSILGVVIGCAIIILVAETGGIPLKESSEMYPGMSAVVIPSISLFGTVRSFILGLVLVSVISVIPASIAARFRPIKALGYA